MGGVIVLETENLKQMLGVKGVPFFFVQFERTYSCTGHLDDFGQLGG